MINISSIPKEYKQNVIDSLEQSKMLIKIDMKFDSESNFQKGVLFGKLSILDTLLALFLKDDTIDFYNKYLEYGNFLKDVINHEK